MDSKELSRERFGKYAATYVTSVVHAQGPDLERIVALVGEQPSWEALDIATGGGHTALAVAPHVAHVVATDITEPMLAQAREFVLSRNATNVTFLSADAEELPFAVRNFDLVTCRLAAHHFPEVKCFLAEVARVLRPGGLFLLQDMLAPENADAALWINNFERRRDPSHNRTLSRTEWQRDLESCGLTVETFDRFEKRMSLERWVSDQGGSSQDLAELHDSLEQAPPLVGEWMKPEDLEGPDTSFVIVHGLFSARSRGSE